ncbi:major facilitator superfamily domain-containing protein [Mycena rebaudengoi]|nr:major facilitator superfamily domain-containing protein [Mycena rebaudengoi]
MAERSFTDTLMAHPVAEEKFDEGEVENSDKEVDNFPEGGRAAWMVVFGAFLLNTAAFGYALSYGTFQQYYQLTLLRHRSSADIAWIGSLQYALLNLPGLPAARLFDLGYFRPLLITSLAIATIGNFLLAECTEYWHFVLCQGVLLGTSVGATYLPGFATVSQWFKQRRPLAFAVISFGACVGGIMYPIIFRNLVSRVGFKWTIRTIAFINLVLFILAILTMKTRFSPTKVVAKPFNLKSFLSTKYCVYVFTTTISLLGVYTPLIFISIAGVSIGMDPSFAFYLVAIANASSVFGRVLSGVLALRFGPLNVMIIFMFLTATFTYIWPYVTSHSVYILITVLYGFVSGPFLSLFAATTSQLGEPQDYGKRLGLQITIISLGALGGPPISGAIQGLHGSSYHEVGIYAGTMTLASALIMVVTKYLASGRILHGKF